MRKLFLRASFRLFRLCQRAGLNVLPKTYYSPIQDYRWLENNKELWLDRSRLTGIEWSVDSQFAWLERICGPYYPEVAGLAFYHDSTERAWGPGYGPIESQVLHCFMRSVAPRNVLEIGSGQSTMCMIHASAMNERDGRGSSRITAIDPYPRKELQKHPNVTILKASCQSAPRDLFSALQPGDLLFVDSSHAVKVGSDVIRIYLEIIPSLPAGIFVHIHDVFLPYLYGPSTLSPYFVNSSQETALFCALLVGNSRVSV
jgi:hypothetical protein